LPGPFGDPIAKTRRHLDRYHHIADILVRHGLENVADQLGLPMPPGWTLVTRHKHEEMTFAERLRAALEELGPTAIKFGQVLSTRPDILGDDVIAELEKLQDDVPAEPYADIAAVVVEELGAPLTELFSDFSETPLAAASMGQVHRATLFDGSQVVVKVQRPGIARQIQTDVEVVTELAEIAERRTRWAKEYGVQELVGEFTRTLNEQLDFSLEAGYASRFRDRMAPDGRFAVPAVIWDLSTKRVLTMSYLETVKVNRVEELREAGHDLPAIARTLLSHSLEESLIDGMFHGDPHPGNIGIAQDGTIVYMDFGLVGFLAPDLRRQIGDLIVALVEDDSHGIAEALMDIGRVRDRGQVDELAAQAGRVARRYLGQSLSRFSMGEALTEQIRMAVKYGARCPGEAALLFKTLMSIEGLCLRLDPALEISDVAAPIAKQLMRDRFSPERLQRLAQRNAAAAARIVLGFPERAERLLDKAEGGTMRFSVDLVETEDIERRVDIAINRLVVGILVASTLVASALVIRSGLGPMWWGLPLLGLGGLLTGFAIGARLVMAITRSGKI
jgi:ubiquinone biosynthesis protein